MFLASGAAHIHLLTCCSFYFYYFKKTPDNPFSWFKNKDRDVGQFSVAESNVVWTPGPGIILYVGKSISKIKFQKWDC